MTSRPNTDGQPVGPADIPVGVEQPVTQFVQSGALAEDRIFTVLHLRKEERMPATRLAPFLGAKEGNQPIDPLVAGNGPRRWRLANRQISATPADRCIGESSCRLAENGFRPASSGGPASHADSGKCVRKKESRGTRVPTWAPNPAACPPKPGCVFSWTQA